MMRSVCAGALSWLIAPPALACPYCRPAVDASIFDERFATTLFLLLLPLVFALGIGLAIYHAGWLTAQLNGRRRCNKI